MMGKSNTALLKLAKSYLGKGGTIFRNFCGVGGAWCCSYVTYIFHKGGDSALFYGGKKVSYCPSAIVWCKANLAMIPPYLAMPSDIIFFDWNANNIPDHIGLVDHHDSCDAIYTIEGNTSGGIVALKKRNTAYVLGVYRPHFTASYKLGKLKIDGIMGYSTIANLQRALKTSGHYKGDIDGILGKGTVKALQKKCGATADGAWAEKTSKKVQKMLKNSVNKSLQIDGLFGKASVKALQKWINAQNITVGDKIAESAKKYVGKVQYKKGGTSLKTGVDCTGFVQEIYKLHGIQLKNTDLVKKGPLIKSIRDALPGDIINYHDSRGSHHGIYIGNGKIVHAANTKQDVCIAKYDSPSKPIKNIRRAWK